jgi:hypothetical protein
MLIADKKKIVQEDYIFQLKDKNKNRDKKFKEIIDNLI